MGVDSHGAACPRTLVIAGTSSGVGKTSTTVAILAALRCWDDCMAQAHSAFLGFQQG